MEEKREILLMGTVVTALFLPQLGKLLRLSWNQWDFDYLHQLRICLSLCGCSSLFPCLKDETKEFPLFFFMLIKRFARDRGGSIPYPW